MGRIPRDIQAGSNGVTTTSTEVIVRQNPHELSVERIPSDLPQLWDNIGPGYVTGSDSSVYYEGRQSLRDSYVRSTEEGRQLFRTDIISNEIITDENYALSSVGEARSFRHQLFAGLRYFSEDVLEEYIGSLDLNTIDPRHVETLRAANSALLNARSEINSVMKAKALLAFARFYRRLNDVPPIDMSSFRHESHHGTLIDMFKFFGESFLSDLMAHIASLGSDWWILVIPVLVGLLAPMLVRIFGIEFLYNTKEYIYFLFYDVLEFIRKDMQALRTEGQQLIVDVRAVASRIQSFGNHPINYRGIWPRTTSSINNGGILYSIIFREENLRNLNTNSINDGGILYNIIFRDASLRTDQRMVTTREPQQNIVESNNGFKTIIKKFLQKIQW